MNKVIKNWQMKERGFEPYTLPIIPGRGGDERGEMLLERDNPHDRIEEVKQDAEAIITKAKTEAERIKEEARKEGFTLGREEIEKRVHSLFDILKELDHLMENVYKDIEEELLEMVLSISKVVIQREVADERGIVLSAIKRALAEVLDHERIKILLNPSDLEFVKRADKEFLSTSYPDSKNILIEASSTVGEGGCLIETNLGNIDARIEKQLEEVRKALWENLSI